jgi:hypothetical protein
MTKKKKQKKRAKEKEKKPYLKTKCGLSSFSKLQTCI